MKELVENLRTIAPIYSFEAPQGVTAPYMTYSLSESAIRTKSGIAGYEGTLSIGVYAPSRESCEALVNSVIESIDATMCDGRRLYFIGENESDYQDIGLIAKELTFNTLR